MALMSSNYTYNSLASKYDDFVLPAYKITVGGTQILTDSASALQYLEVTLSVEDTGSAHFFITQEYDRSSSSFEGSLKSTLKTGKIVEIYLGYNSDTTLVFKGFIGALDVVFDAEDSLGFEVLAFDARWLMKTDNLPYVFYEKANYSDIATEILTRYKTLATPKVDSTSDKLTELVVQKENDYDFLTKTLALKTGCELFVVADELYFRKKTSESAFYTIDISSGLKYFSKSDKYLNKSIEVQGLDLAFSEVISSTVTAKNSNQTDVISASTSVYTFEDCLTASEAKTIASSIQTSLQNECSTAKGIVIGLPEIVPGRYVEISKLDSTVNDKYYIVEVIHKIDEEGFETSFLTKG
ncbi:MAG: hypothetical protein R3Y09_08950 [Clostridia bacterium]